MIHMIPQKEHHTKVIKKKNSTYTKAISTDGKWRCKFSIIYKVIQVLSRKSLKNNELD